jgi:hypothetical protein
MLKTEEWVEYENALPWPHFPFIQRFDAGAVSVVVDEPPACQFA